jgi:hypothetical protein
MLDLKIGFEEYLNDKRMKEKLEKRNQARKKQLEKDLHVTSLSSLCT